MPPLSLLARALAWWTTSSAAPVVVTGDAPDDAVAAMVERGLAPAPSDVRALLLSDLRSRPPFLDGSGRVWACGSVPETRIADLITTAELALGYTRLLEADDALDDALALATCRSDLDAASLWRVWFLKGIVATYQEDPERAAHAFVAARTLDPDRPWDDAYVDGQAAFDAAAAQAPASVRLTILPDPGGAVQIDGRPASWTGNQVLLRPGVHFVQIGDRVPVTLRVEVEGRGIATLVVPALLKDDLFTYPERPERWRDLDTILRGLVADPAASFALYDPPDLWFSEAIGSPYIARLGPPPVPVRSPPPGWVWGAGGLGLGGAATAIGCAIGGMVARSHAVARIHAPYADFVEAEQAYQMWGVCLVASEVVAAGGLGTATIGLATHHPPRSSR